MMRLKYNAEEMKRYLAYAIASRKSAIKSVKKCKGILKKTENQLRNSRYEVLLQDEYIKTYKIKMKEKVDGKQ